MSPDVDTRIARTLDQLEDLSLSQTERDQAKENLALLQQMKRA